MKDGTVCAPLPDAARARDNALASLKRLPTALRSLFPAEDIWRVDYSEELLALREQLRRVRTGAVR